MPQVRVDKYMISQHQGLRTCAAMHVSQAQSFDDQLS